MRLAPLGNNFGNRISLGTRGVWERGKATALTRALRAVGCSPKDLSIAVAEQGIRPGRLTGTLQLKWLVRDAGSLGSRYLVESD